MKTSMLAVLGVAALANAQATLPACAQSCALNAIGATGCTVTDAACICTNEAFLSGVQSCIQGVCSAADIQATLEYAQSFCGAAGVTISAPASSAAASTSVTVVASSASEASSAPAATTTEVASSSVPSGPPVTQISDGQPQATTAAPTAYTGAASPLQQNLFGGLAGVALGVVAAL